MIQILEEAEPGTVGVIMEGASAEYKVAYNCELYTVGTLGTRYYGFALPKGKKQCSQLWLFHKIEIQRVKFDDNFRPKCLHSFKISEIYCHSDFP